MRAAAAIAERPWPAWQTFGVESVSPWLMSGPGLLVGAVLLVTVGLFLMVRRGPRQRWVGATLALLGFLVMVSRLESLGGLGRSAGFWCLAALTLSAAVATITSHNPVYSAIWFAVSLLGTGALFLLQGAQFLAVATVVVYAGAIVVTFLFVVMLAQPSGQAYYDRIQWGVVPTLLAVLTGAALLGGITLAVSGLTGQRSLGRTSSTAADRVSDARADQRGPARSGGETSETFLRSAPDRLPSGPRSTSAKLGGSDDPAAGSQHVAELGGQLFARHLVAVEVAGTLLLVALIGAVAIVIQGKASADGAGGPSHE